jgi:hypothetical protein
MIYLLINNLSFLPEQMNNDSMHLLLQLQICNKDESNTIYVGIFQVSTCYNCKFVIRMKATQYMLVFFRCLLDAFSYFILVIFILE